MPEVPPPERVPGSEPQEEGVSTRRSEEDASGVPGRDRDAEGPDQGEIPQADSLPDGVPPEEGPLGHTSGDAPPSGPVPERWQREPYASAPGSGLGVPPYAGAGASPEFAGPAGVMPGTGEGGTFATAPPVEKRPLGRSLGRGVREIAETIILALLIFLVVRAVVQNFQVEGDSMEPTLHSSEYLLVNKAQYWEINLETLSKFIPFIDPGDDPTRFIFGGPGRGDVVVFKSPDSVPGQPESDFIKRIIGLPGDTVEVRDGFVFINGKALDEPYILEQPRSTYPPTTVPPDYYFVLGDNRNNSRDSRSIGMVPKESIIGKAWLTYWPFSAFGLVNNTSVKPGSGDAEVPTPAKGEPAAASLP